MSNRKFNEMVTKARVIGAQKEFYWYAKFIGKTFDVMFSGINGFSAVDPTDGARGYLESEDIEPVEIRYNNERYRLESRKAEVGEKVVIIKNPPEDWYRVGEIGVCCGYDDFDFSENKRVYYDGKWSVPQERYRVLVPVKSAASALTANVNVKLCEDTTKIIDMLTSLSTKVAELEREVQTLKDANIPESTAKSIVDAITKAPKQLTRADVVAKAQVDIIWLQTVTENDRPVYRLPIARLCTAEFIVNREKRTVVVLLRREIRKSEVVSKGIAKCAPEDVFNVDIGKAIALRRALGLTVPSEYADAPKPEGIAVGDVVNGKYKQGVDFYSEDRRFTLTSYNAYKACFYYAEDGSDYIYANQIGQVIDDSDREEYRKGARC